MRRNPSVIASIAGLLCLLGPALALASGASVTVWSNAGQGAVAEPPGASVAVSHLFLPFFHVSVGSRRYVRHPSIVHAAPVMDPGLCRTPPPSPPVLPLLPPPPSIKKEQERSIRAAFSMTLQRHGQGAAADLAVRVEGRRLGVHASSTHVIACLDGCVDGLRGLQLFEGHLTYSLLSGERGRLRLEGGASVAVSSDVLQIGPEAGISAEVRLLGPIGIIAVARDTPFPHRRLDVRGGLYLALGGLRIEAGKHHSSLRMTEGVRSLRGDVRTGYYVGASLVF
jgi:hypothetical protein